QQVKRLFSDKSGANPRQGGRPVPAAPGPAAAGTVHFMNDEPRCKVPRNHDDVTSLCQDHDDATSSWLRLPPEWGWRDARVPRSGALALARVEDLAGVEGAAHRGLQREGARVEFPAHAVPFQDADAVLTGDGAAQRDGRVEELLERGLGRRLG